MERIFDWTKYGYSIEKKLGLNATGGRVTYLAREIATNNLVVIKQFQFAIADSSWSDYNAYQAEINTLKALEHPSIPAYIDSVETDTGFCLIQEYKAATPLSEDYRWTLEEIKEVAIAILKILIYLQQQNPTVIHRDLKPENILIDRSSEIKVYLVDFGFARNGGGEVAVSSVVKGTLGFMPPEQMFNRQLTKASDLYSLGVTLICLLTNIKSQDIGQLIDYETNTLNFRSRLSRLNPIFLSWLDRMVSPNPKTRYANADLALQALKPISLIGNQTQEKNSKALETTIVAIVTIFVFLTCLQPFIKTWYGLNKYGQNRADERYFQAQLFEQGSASCVGCNLEGISLVPGQRLSRSDLGRANLKDAKLIDADISNSYLTDTNLKSADLTNADLSGSSLERANLTNANLTGANLQKARLSYANFQGANLRDADLRSASIYYAKFRGADLTNALLPDGYKAKTYEGAILTGTKFDPNVN